MTDILSIPGQQKAGGFVLVLARVPKRLRASSSPSFCSCLFFQILFPAKINPVAVDFEADLPAQACQNDQRKTGEKSKNHKCCVAHKNSDLAKKCTRARLSGDKFPSQVRRPGNAERWALWEPTTGWRGSQKAKSARTCDCH